MGLVCGEPPLDASAQRRGRLGLGLRLGWWKRHPKWDELWCSHSRGLLSLLGWADGWLSSTTLISVEDRSAHQSSSISRIFSNPGCVSETPTGVRRARVVLPSGQPHADSLGADRLPLRASCSPVDTWPASPRRVALAEPKAARLDALSD
jgi:hypothetical protein